MKELNNKFYNRNEILSSSLGLLLIIIAIYIKGLYSMAFGLIGILLFFYALYHKRKNQEKINYDERIEHIENLAIRYSYVITILFVMGLEIVNVFYPLPWSLTFILLSILGVAMVSIAIFRFIMERH